MSLGHQYGDILAHGFYPTEDSHPPIPKREISTSDGPDNVEHLRADIAGAWQSTSTTPFVNMSLSHYITDAELIFIHIPNDDSNVASYKIHVEYEYNSGFVPLFINGTSVSYYFIQITFIEKVIFTIFTFHPAYISISQSLK